MKTDDEPPGFCSERSNRYLRMSIHPTSDGRTPDASRSCVSSDNRPVVLLNHLYRTGHILYFPRSIGGVCGNSINCEI